MALDTNSQTYLLKILEIPDKSVTQKYLSLLKDKLEKRDLKYTINFVVDENLVHDIKPVMEQSGGDNDGSTFPYNLFEDAINKVITKRREQQQREKGWISNAYDKIHNYNKERQGLFDRLFSYKPLADVPEIVDKPVSTDQGASIDQGAATDQVVDIPSEEGLISDNVEFPSNYIGVLHIQVTIYNLPIVQPDIILGLHELNAFINSEI